MKTKRLLLAVVCLVLFSVFDRAQAADLPPGFAEMRQYPVFQRSVEIGLQAAIRSFWDGSGTNLMALELLQVRDIRAALDISDEQFQQIQSVPMNLDSFLLERPEIQEWVVQMQELHAQGRIQGNPFTSDLDAETMDIFLNNRKMVAALSIEIISDAIDNTLTPEQQQKMQEAQLVAMGEMPIISPYIFEVLGLTDTQRQQMEEIKRELEPEFERHIEEFARGQMIVLNKLFDEFEKQGSFNNTGNLGQEIIRTMQENTVAATRKLMAEDPEFRRITEELQSKGTAFSTQFQVKMFDVLTDEQWRRLQELIDNPPPHAQIFMERLRQQRGEAAESEGDVWQPGPGSWRPGMPIPEEYRQQRNLDRRFPRPQN